MIEIKDRVIALATVDALQMWSDERYIPFLQMGPTRQTMDHEWFDKFLGQWNVARTISSDKHEEVRGYLNKVFRLSLKKKSAAVIDLGAAKIADKGWSHANKKSGIPSKPVSLVSKIAFFYQPDFYVPMDKFSRKGVNVLRGKIKNLGIGHHAFPSYESYYNEFELCFAKHKGMLANELKCNWVKGLAKKYGCEPNLIMRDAFQRKVFDNILMRLGDRQF